jgi:hypothetical protein
MNDDYLWDKSGEPDPEVERLENLLGEFRHSKPLHRETAPRQWLRYAAAVALVAAGSAWFLMQKPRVTWDVAAVRGEPKVGYFGIGKAGKLGVGQYLETNANAVAKLDVGEIGEVTVDPNSRLRLVKSNGDEHRLSLQRGVIHALIWAPPRQFFVDTPSAVTVDLGCKYTLEVSDSGDGRVTVETGWVAFESKGRESFVPAGAACVTKRDGGPGVPYYLDATSNFRKAVIAGNTLGVLAEARPRDAMTLWHLMARVPTPQREPVYAKMAALAPPPQGVTRDGILALNPQMMDQWWDSLGLDSANWWRKWKAELPQ